LEQANTQIERQLVRPHGNGVQFSAPKTKYGKRSIALGSKTIEVMRVHYERQQAERLAAGDRWQEYDFIFTNRSVVRSTIVTYCEN